jgi:hypothetical protein
MLSNMCISNVRTGDLNNTNRKFILLRLLMQLLGNGEFQEQLLSCCAASVSENVEEDESAPIISLVDDDGKESQGDLADDGAPAVVDDNSADHTLPPPKGKKKDTKGTKVDKTAKALKELGSFGDFSFDSSTPRVIILETAARLMVILEESQILLLTRVQRVKVQQARRRRRS